ncbi:MAG: protein of unknown function (DUF4815) [Candidatus Kentron sp. G]|nr:MAG: protein of unknown function (DUF4815) [Candidatus Kentron sp. G]VFM98593.1 MAG: protein of unknown function (DUF4815) [Candidatus Kentron sp. G]VFN00340.1 MAG: protein of unknown function (DUF4815) [Candidatus Kentron sp. G]
MPIWEIIIRLPWGYVRQLYLAGRGIQSAEFNELQDIVGDRITGIGRALLSDGDIIEGCECVVSGENVTVASGRVYLRGSVHAMGNAAFEIPATGTRHIGVWYEERIITHLEDPALVDPAIGTRNYQEPGAARTQALLSWGLDTDDRPGSEFYPVHTIIDGVLLIKAPPPQLDSVTTALARYDRESNGSYVVEGLGVTVVSADGGNQVYSIAEGKAHIDGFELERPASLRLASPDNPDLLTVSSEPHRFEPNQDGVMVISLHYSPIATVAAVDITRESVATVTHGNYSGVSDPLPHNAILEIMSVVQGQTEYEEGTEFRLTGDMVDWSPTGGAEPAPGSTYQVIYRHRLIIQPDAIDEDAITVSNAVGDSLVLVDYSWKLPRIDVITLDRTGVVRRIEGLSHPRSFVAPDVSGDQLPLAELHQNWRGVPEVRDVSTRVVAMSDLQTMRSSIQDLYSLIAIERLRNDANASDPAAKLGIFVDPFLDDDMRDQGMEQTAAIVDEELTLPIQASVADALQITDPQTLAYELVPVLEQPARTGEMKINPYQAFEPMPARVRLSPGTDRWTTVITRWSSPITRRFWGRRRTTTGIQVIARSTEVSETLRSRRVAFRVDGFGPGETVVSITFDGVSVEPIE